MTDRLYRSPDDRMLAGVAGGVAEMLDTDPSLVRVVWVLLALLTGGIALVVYVVMAIVVPERPAGLAPATQPPPGSPPTGGQPRNRAARGRGGLVIGAVLIVVGALFLVRQLVPAFDLGLWWPIVVIGLGIALIIVAITPSRRSG